jgi:hypothetical protein
MPSAHQLASCFTVIAFFGAEPPRSVHCLNRSFVSGVQQWTQVSSVVTNQRKKSLELNCWYDHI